MEWSKIKNIILLILLLVNGLLLVQTADREHKSAKYREETRLGAVEVLRQAGYELDPAVLPADAALFPLTAERDREAESALAGALLGETVRTDDGGRVAYAEALGEASFRSDGSFTVSFQPEAHPLEGADEAVHGVKLLTAAGYPCELVELRREGEAAVVIVRQTWEGAPLFNCEASLTYRDGALRAVEGWRLIGAPVRAEGSAAPLDVATVLLRFLAGVRDGGYVCTRVDALIPGYQTTVAPGGVSRLNPVWRVVTDSRAFLVDGLTGALTPAL